METAGRLFAFGIGDQPDVVGTHTHGKPFLHLAELVGEVLLCAVYGHAAQEDRTQLLQVDGAVAVSATLTSLTEGNRAFISFDTAGVMSS